MFKKSDREELQAIIENNELLSKKIKIMESNINILDARLWQTENPNGKINYCYWNHDAFIFEYVYNGKKYESFVPNEFVDYSKYKNGYIFVTEKRNRAYFIECGADRGVEIPCPCFHE